MGRRYNRKFVIFVSFLLIISFTSHTTSLSSLGLRESVENSFELGPPYANVENPLAYPSIRDERWLGPVIIEQIKQTPIPDTNMFLQSPNKNPARVFFSRRERVGIEPGLQTTLSDVFVIPCYSGDELYFARLVIYKDKLKEPDIEVYPEQEFRKDHERIGVSGEVVERLLTEFGGIKLREDRTLYFIHTSDESVKAVSKFLERIDASIMNMRFQELVMAKKLIFSKDPIPEVGIIAVSEAEDVKTRAYSILGTMFSNEGVEYGRFEEAFNSFWLLWERNKGEEFDLEGVAPELIPLVKQIERDSKGSNEGSIVLDDNAYELIQETVAITSDDQDAVIRDIKRIFKRVAKHFMEKHNQAAAKEKEAAAEKIMEACRRAAIVSSIKAGRLKMTSKGRVPAPNNEDLAIPVSQIKGISPKVCAALQEAKLTTVRDILKAGKEGRLLELGEIGQKMRPISSSDMPGLDPGKFRFGEICDLKSALPTDLVFKDGTIWININFVKLMWKIGYLWDLKGPNGRIYEYDAYGDPDIRPTHSPEESPSNTVLGNIYESILYSMAWHTIGGHFPINEWGFALFRDDEYWAQGERGGKDYIYVNIFAMLYYWIEILEMHKYPERRCRALLAKYPQLLRKFGEISEGHRRTVERKMPDHIFMFLRDMVDRKIIPMPYEVEKTEHTRLFVLRTIKERQPNAVSNEGTDDSSNAESNPSMLNKLFGLFSDVERSLSLQEIKDILVGYENGDIDAALSLLVNELRIVDRKSDEREAVVALPGLVYSSIPLTGKQMEDVQGILGKVKGVPKDDELKELKGRIFKITESRWADTVVNGVDDLKVGGAKRLLALELDWIPAKQKELFVKPLIQALGNELSCGEVEIIIKDEKETAEGFAKRIVGMCAIEGVAKGSILPQNIVVLASESTIRSEAIKPIRAEKDSDENKAFLFGVNGSELSKNEDSYIRLMEMITMAIRISLNQKSMSSHPNIVVNPLNKRTIIFIPKAEPLDLEHNRDVYKAQIGVLLAA